MNFISQKKVFSFSLNKNLKKVIHRFDQGFTLLEMLMVLAIFSILTVVIIFNYGRFNSQTIMTNMAYEIALATRQAQVYSLGVRSADVAENDFNNRFGVYFNEGISDKNFVFFIDQGPNPDSKCLAADNSNCFGCLSGGECLEKYNLTRDIYIDKICVSADNEPVTVDGICTDETVEDVVITFERPNPDAIIYSEDLNESTNSNNASVAIIIRTQYGDQRAVLVQNTGQISVEFLNDITP